MSWMLLDDRRRLDARARVLYASWIPRRRFVSSIAAAIDSVVRSAYMTTLPPMLRAARPIIWISDHELRRKPSLSASRIATSVTSGRSIPSRRRLMPTSTSNTPSRRSRRIATRSSVSTSLWRYWTLTPSSLQVVGEVLGHLLRQRRDERPLAALDPQPDLLHQVVDLAVGRADVDRSGRRRRSAGSAARRPARSARARTARASRSCRRPG